MVTNMKNDPCWKGYEMVGTKTKGKKRVPNCVPKESMFQQTLEENWKLDKDAQQGATIAKLVLAGRATKDQYFDFLKSLRSKYGSSYSTKVHKEISTILSSPKPQTTVESVEGVDTVTVDVPLLIRLLEYAREDAKTDMDLHRVASRLIKLGQQGNVLTMQDYNKVVKGK